MKVFMGIAMAILLTGCASTPESAAPEHHYSAARAENPASMNCIQNNGKLEIQQTPQGEQVYCLLPGGKRCEEWDMFRGNCPTRTVNVNMKKFGW